MLAELQGFWFGMRQYFWLAFRVPAELATPVQHRGKSSIVPDQSFDTIAPL